MIASQAFIAGLPEYGPLNTSVWLLSASEEHGYFHPLLIDLIPVKVDDQ
jgi:hypothetical protein